MRTIWREPLRNTRRGERRSSTLPSYSPRGDTDEKPNVRDARYVPPSDEPVILPFERPGAVYVVTALVVVAFIVSVAGAMVAH